MLGGKYGYLAGYLNNEYSDAVKAKSLWTLGKMELKHPAEIEIYVDDIAGYMDDDSPKLRERSANAGGIIEKTDKNIVIHHLDRLMKIRYDES